MSYGGQAALERMRRQLTTVVCQLCSGQGWILEFGTEVGYGHPCGGDERRCQVTCPVPEEVAVEVQRECPACRGAGRLR